MMFEPVTSDGPYQDTAKDFEPVTYFGIYGESTSVLAPAPIPGIKTWEIEATVQIQATVRQVPT